MTFQPHPPRSGRRLGSPFARTIASAIVLLGLGCSAEEAASPPADVDTSERLPGGATTNTLLLGVNAFTRPAENITPDHEPLFYAGNAAFNQPWVEAPASTDGHDGLGPLFNARSCAACHFKDGRGRPPLEPDEDFLGLLLRLSVDGKGKHGEAVPDPNYGGQLQPFAQDDVPAEGTPRVSYEEIPGEYADGEAFTLLEPTYVIESPAYGPLADDLRISPRVAPAVFGLGLLEAIAEERLLELADPDDTDGDGISGRVNHVWDVASESVTIGRFGWKAEQPSVRQQSAGAFLGDIGVTSSMFPNQDCTSNEPECLAATEGGTPELDDEILDRVELYGQLLAVPVREGFRSESILQGKQLFSSLGCADCHTPSHVTRADAALEELRSQKIYPYTDLLLHDLGEGLSDHRPSFEAEGNEWRTPPLWGLRLYSVVGHHDRLLHDGRARGVAEAILWHGGEAQNARDAFVELSATERELLVHFVESL